jgi:hypothetical protein
MQPGSDFFPRGVCGAYSQITDNPLYPPNFPTVALCLGAFDPVTFLPDYDQLLRCFLDDATVWSESGEQMVRCMLDDDLCGEYLDDSLASCFLNDKHSCFPEPNPVSSDGITFPIETGFGVGEEHIKCLLTKLNVSDAADYITRKMVELEVLNEAGLNIGGCADYADYEEAWMCGRNCYRNEERGYLTSNQAEVCIVDCVFDHIQVGEGARYFTQCLVDDTLCRSEMDEHLDESWDCMQACSQQSLANDNATLRPEVSCWVPCMQKLLAIEDLVQLQKSPSPTSPTLLHAQPSPTYTQYPYTFKRTNPMYSYPPPNSLHPYPYPPPISLIPYPPTITRILRTLLPLLLLLPSLSFTRSPTD